MDTNIYIDVKQLKQAVGRRQKKIAPMVNLAQPTVCQKLNGRRNITLDDLNRIANAIGRNPMDFLVLRKESADDHSRTRTP